MSAGDKAETADDTGKGCAIIGVIALVVVGGCTALMGGSDSESGSEIGAMIACESFVEDQLRAPATASFPPARDADITHDGEDRYRVRAHVDAENAFGATVRTSFICEVTRVDDGWRGSATLLD